jgi:cell division protein FtsQ
MAKSKKGQPRIKTPVVDDDEDDMPAGPARGEKMPYSVAWFREKTATYALGTIVCCAAMVTAAAWMGGSLGAFGQRMDNGFTVIMRSAGLAVKDVRVLGLDPVVQERALKLAAVRVGESMLSADPYAIKKRVETLEAVDKVKVLRMWPDQITIVADPRQPIALWENKGEWRVIDQRGRTFAEVDPKDFVQLPHIKGPEAASAAAGLLTLMADYPDLSIRMSSATRVGGRRWDVSFRGGADVALPEDDRLKEALGALNLLQARNRLLDLPVTHIDARHPERFALRPMPGAPSDPLTGGA